jgi:hypothetical protein
MTGVFGEENVGAGFDLVYDASVSRFTTYNWLIYWSKSTTRLALRQDVSDAQAYTLGPLKLSYFTSLSNQTSLAAELSMGAKENESRMQCGLEHSFSSDLTGKVKFNELGFVATSVKHKLNENAVVTTSSGLNFSRGLQWPVLALGFKLKLSS